MNNLKIHYSAASHVCGRRRNEDNYLAERVIAPVWAYDQCSDRGEWDTSAVRVAAVCDGIGGGARGDVASLTALKTIQAEMEQPGNQELPLEELAVTLAEAARVSVEEYYHKIRSRGGCTLSMVLIRGDRWAYLNIGDSPGFLWRKDRGELTELSRRHNLYWEKHRLGFPTEPGDECRLMRYLGRTDCTALEMAHTAQGELKPGDALLLCSDGITNFADNKQLSRWMEKQVSAADMVQAAASDPESDNSTAVCLRAAEADQI